MELTVIDVCQTVDSRLLFQLICFLEAYYFT